MVLIHCNLRHELVRGVDARHHKELHATDCTVPAQKQRENTQWVGSDCRYRLCTPPASCEATQKGDPLLCWDVRAHFLTASTSIWLKTRVAFSRLSPLSSAAEALFCRYQVSVSIWYIYKKHRNITVSSSIASFRLEAANFSVVAALHCSE